MLYHLPIQQPSKEQKNMQEKTNKRNVNQYIKSLYYCDIHIRLQH